eukprot:3509705-Rhodomonas_salina.1
MEVVRAEPAAGFSRRHRQRARCTRSAQRVPGRALPRTLYAIRGCTRARSPSVTPLPILPRTRHMQAKQTWPGRGRGGMEWNGVA